MLKKRKNILLRNSAVPSQHSGMASAWTIWQLADSAFPAGSLAHSGGLEASWQFGSIRDDDDLLDFLRTHLAQAGRSQLPVVAAALRGPDRCVEIDQFCDVLLSNHISNRASRAQGRALLSSTEAIYGAPALRKLRAESVEKSLACHLPVVFGVLAAALDIGTALALRLYLFTTLRGVVSSAVRLGVVGPLKAQALQHVVGPFAGEVARRCERIPLVEATHTAPVLELFQANQDSLYSRLFQS